MESPTATGYVPAFRYWMLRDTRPSTCCQRRPAPARQYRNMRVGRNVFSGNRQPCKESRGVKLCWGLGLEALGMYAKLLGNFL